MKFLAHGWFHIYSCIKKIQKRNSISKRNTNNFRKIKTMSFLLKIKKYDGKIKKRWKYEIKRIEEIANLQSGIQNKRIEEKL